MIDCWKKKVHLLHKGKVKFHFKVEVETGVLGLSPCSMLKSCWPKGEMPSLLMLLPRRRSQA